MKFKLVYATQEEVPEAVRAAYAAGADGKFYFQGDLQEDHPALAGLRGALQTERTHRETAERELAPFKQLGKSADELKAVLTAKPDGKKDGKASADELESLRKQMQEAHAEEVAKLTGRIEQLTGFVNEQVGENAVLGALTKVAPKTAHLLKPHAMQRVSVVERDGRYVAVVIDPKTKKVRYDANGAELTLDKLAEEMKGDPEFAPAFPGSGAAGGGASGDDQRGAGGKKVIKASDAEAFAANMEGIAKGDVIVQ